MDKPIFNIDQNSLNEAFVDQPTMMYDFTSNLAIAKKEYERTKASLGVIRAKVKMDIRRNPKEYGIPGRPADKVVDDLATMDRRVIKASEVMQEARHKAELLQSGVTALEHRKGALEGLVKLHGQGYFAAVHVTGVGREVMEEIQKKAVRKKGIRNRRPEAT